MDVLSASSSSFFGDKIAWYENIDGLGNFSSEILIETAYEGAYTLDTEDLDGDGDIDIVACFVVDNITAWYENIDGQDTFEKRDIISSIDFGITSITAADMDGDGDADLLSAVTDHNRIGWYENTDGLGNFGDFIIISLQTEYPRTIKANDIDGDGDLDVISTSQDDDKIAWYENMDGKGDFGDQNIISTKTNFPYSVFATDLDKDGDLDILSISGIFNGGEVNWYENLDGKGSYGPKRVIDNNVNEVRSIYASDIDGDNDMDVLITSKIDDKVIWFENLIQTDVNNTSYLDIKIHPNPTTGILILESESLISTINIYNELGQLVYSDNGSNKIDVSHLIPGLYFCKFESIKGETGAKMIIKN